MRKIPPTALYFSDAIGAFSPLDCGTDIGLYFHGNRTRKRLSTCSMAGHINTSKISPVPQQGSAQPRELQAQLDHVLLTVPSLTTLYSRLAEFLLETVQVDAVWLGSPDAEEKVRYHFFAGERVEEFLGGGVIRIEEHPDSPLVRAWRSGIPQYALDWTSDKNLVPGTFWHKRGLQFGWRSSCAIPVSGAEGKRDILILYSKRPNFFADEIVRQFVSQ